MSGGLLALRLLAATARADELAWYVDAPIESVQLQAPEGGLPEENLEPLLRLKQGDTLDLAKVRQDIALLYRTGAFAQVEAVATPFVVEEDGRVRTTVMLTYLVRSPPRLAELRVDGARGAAARVARAAVGLEEGGTFYAAEDASLVASRVTEALRRDGWVEAKVEARVGQTALDEPTLTVQVTAGVPARYGVIEISADVLEADDRCGLRDRRAARRGDPCDLTTRQLRRWLRQAGVRSGRRITAAGRDEAQQVVADRLVDRGWLSARVTTVVPPVGAADGERPFTLLIEGKGRLVIDAHGPPGQRVVRLPPEDQLTQVMGLFAGDRLAESSLDEADRRLRLWYDRQGYPAARPEIAARRGDGRTYLDVAVDTGPRHVIEEIRVDGAQTWEERFLAGAAREADPDTIGAELYSADGLARSDRAVDELYRGRGFLSAEVSTQVEPLGPPRRRLLQRPWLLTQRVALRMTVVEGPQTLQRSLDILGGIGLETEVVRAQGDLGIGGPYQPARIDALAQAIAAAYRAKGYLNVHVSVENRLRNDGAESTLTIDPGNPLLLRSVIIQGNKRTRRRVIEREVAMTVGEPITPEGLLQTRSNLYTLDLFRLVSPELVGDDDRARDLLLRVEEKPNMLIENGGGVSSDQGVQLKSRFTHRNLSGLGQTVNVLGQVGFGWSGDGWLLDTATPTYRAAVRYQVPWVIGRGSHIVVDGLLGELTQEPTFRISRSGGSVGLRWSQGRTWDLFVDYRIQVRRLSDIDPGALVGGDPWIDALGLEAGDPRSALTLPSERRIVSGPELILVTDLRDDRFNPHKGLFTSTVLDISDGAFSDPWTARAEVRVEQFVPAGPLVLDFIGRGGIGTAGAGRQVLPIDERFTLGGATTLRGFSLGSAGPANYIARPDIDFPSQTAPVIDGLALRDAPAHWVPTGGELLLAGTVEVRIPFSSLGANSIDTTSLALFTDVGHLSFLDPNVTTDSTVIGDERPVRVGVGVGLRISTPIGPASIDLGVNPWRLPGREEPLLTPHLSLGEL